MLDRESEIDAFKKVDLSVIASSFGFAVEKKRSTRKMTMMSNGADKIAVSYNGSHYVFWTVDDNHRSGTVIDFVQKMVEPGCHMGRVRQLLRPFLNSGCFSDVLLENKGRYAKVIEANKVDLAAVATRYSKFVPIAKPHPYLCDVRGIPFELLQSKRLFGRVRECPRRGSVVFPHFGCPDGQASERRCLTGYEIKGASMNLFSSGSRKGLWITVGIKGDSKLAFAESGLDALSYMAAHGEQGLRVASISGKMNPQQPILVRSAIERMGEGAQIIAAFDNDAGGDDLTQQLSDILKEVARSDLIFLDNRPVARGQDYNDVLMNQVLKMGRVHTMAPAFGR